MKLSTYRLFVGILALLISMAVSSRTADAQSFAYVANNNEDDVSVISTITNTEVARVPVGHNPFLLAATPDGARIYVTNSSDNSVSVINTNTNTVMATVAVGGPPAGLAIRPDGAFVYVANTRANTVSVISTATNTVIATVPGGTDPNGIVFTPNGAFAYVVNDQAVTVLDTATNNAVATVPLPGGFGTDGPGVAITPNGAFVYVSSGGGNIGVICTASNAVVGVVSTTGNTRGSNLYEVALAPNGAFGYAAVAGFSEIAVFDATNTVVTTIPVGYFPVWLAITADGAFAYVTNYTDDTVSVINTASNTVVATIPVGSRPFGVAVATPPRRTAPCVTSLADSGPGSLRSAIAAAIPGDTITFCVSGTITLNTPLAVNTSLSIRGPGASNLSISGNDSVVLVLTVSSGSTVSISGVTIEKGNGYTGAGLYNSGTLTITSSTISHNNGNNGGGIVNDGTLIVTDGTLSENSSFGYGAGILNNGIATVTNTTFSNNRAGGFGLGGGIFNLPLGTATISNSTFSGNYANYYGGGIWNDGGAVTIGNSTFAGNSAQFWGGGIVNNSGTVTISNSTFSDNTANLGGGIFSQGTTFIKGTIVANSPLGNNCFGSFSSAGYNLSDDNSCSAFTRAGDMNHTPTGLDPSGLQNNGGPTQTIALLATSPAVDAIPLNSNSYCTAIDGITTITTDQRGVTRPQGPACDIGAFELGVTTNLALTAPDPSFVSFGSAGPVSLSATLTARGTPVADATVSFTVDGSSIGTATTDRNGVAAVPTFNPSALPIGNHEVRANFSQQTIGGVVYNPSTSAVQTLIVGIHSYTLTYMAGSGGTISGSSAQTVNSNADGTTVAAVPNPGYSFANWSDGVTTASRTDMNVIVNVSVTARFTVITDTIYASAGTGGSVSPSGTVSVNYGSALTFSITPNTGYHVMDVLVDGTSMGAVTAYSFNSVVADHIIAASFAKNYTFIGFLQPIVNPSAVNTGKSGRTYPVKWQLKDDNGNYVTSLAAVRDIQYGVVACGTFSDFPASLIDTAVTGQTNLRYDLTANQFVYNWATPSAGCYVLVLTLDDDSVHPAYFNLSK